MPELVEVIPLASVGVYLSFGSSELYKGYSQHKMNLRNLGVSTYMAGGIGINGEVDCL